MKQSTGPRSTHQLLVLCGASVLNGSTWYRPDPPEAKLLVAAPPFQHIQALLFYQPGVEAAAEILHLSIDQLGLGYYLDL